MTRAQIEQRLRRITHHTFVPSSITHGCFAGVVIRVGEVHCGQLRIVCLTTLIRVEWLTIAEKKLLVRPREGDPLIVAIFPGEFQPRIWLGLFPEEQPDPRIPAEYR